MNGVSKWRGCLRTARTRGLSCSPRWRTLTGLGPVSALVRSDAQCAPAECRQWDGPAASPLRRGLGLLRFNRRSSSWIPFRPKPGHSRCWSCGGQLSRHLFRRKQHQERAEDRIACTVAAFGRLLAGTAVRAEFDLGVAPGIYGSSRRDAWRDGADHRKKPVGQKTLLAAGGRYRDRTCDPYHVKVVLYR